MSHRDQVSYFTHPTILFDILFIPHATLFFIAGKTDAERKIEELTRALEEEMEKNEEQGEYFGICHTCKLKVTGAGQACQVSTFLI